MDPMKNEGARVSEQDQLHNVKSNDTPKRRGHCARFWWAYVIVVVVITVIVVPCV